MHLYLSTEESAALGDRRWLGDACVAVLRRHGVPPKGAPNEASKEEKNLGNFDDEDCQRNQSRIKACAYCTCQPSPSRACLNVKQVCPKHCQSIELSSFKTAMNDNAAINQVIHGVS